MKPAFSLLLMVALWSVGHCDDAAEEEEMKRCQQPTNDESDYAQCPRYTRYYYFTKLNRCVDFVGCINFDQGNDFETKQRCEKTCLRKSLRDPLKDLRCGKQLVTGLDSDGACKAIPRFQYNPKTAFCRQFLGCADSTKGNSFKTAEDCYYYCIYKNSTAEGRFLNNTNGTLYTGSGVSETLQPRIFISLMATTFAAVFLMYPIAILAH